MAQQQVASTERKQYMHRVSELFDKTSAKTTGKIVRYFPDTHLGKGHKGLRDLASKSGVRVETLGRGEYAIFVNRAQTALKMFAPGNVIAHLKMPGHSRLDPRMIALIPRFFNGTKIDYDQALKRTLQKEFGIDQQV